MSVKALPFDINFQSGRGVILLRQPQTIVADYPKLFSLSDLRLTIPNLSFPFDIREGAKHFAHHRTIVQYAELKINIIDLQRWIENRLSEHASAKFTDIELEGSNNALELIGNISFGQQSAEFSLKIDICPLKSRLLIELSELFIYGQLPLAAPQVALDILLALSPDRAHSKKKTNHYIESLFGTTIRGSTQLTINPLSLFLLHSFPRSGFRLPNFQKVSLQSLLLEDKHLVLTYAEKDKVNPSLTGPYCQRCLESRPYNFEESLIRKDIVEAAEAYSNLYKESPDAFVATRMLQLLLLVSPNELTQVLKDVEDHFPTLRSLHITRAILFEQKNNFELALSELRSFIEHPSTSTLQKRAAQRALLQFALNYDSTLAISFLEDLLSKAPRLDDLQLLVELYSENQNWNALSKVLHRILEETEKSAEKAEIFAQLGDLYRIHLSDAERAKSYYLNALNIDPLHEKALFGEIESFVALKEFSQALDKSKMLHQQFVARNDMLSATKEKLRLASLYAHIEDRKTAIEHIEEVLSNTKSASSLVIDATDTLVALKEYRLAIKTLNSALEKNPSAEEQCHIHHQLALIYNDNLDDISAAKAQIELALKNDAKNISVLNSYFRFVCEEKNYEKAEEILKTFLTIYPSGTKKRLDTLIKLAKVQLELNRLDEAESVLIQAKSEPSDNILAFKHLAALYLRRGKEDLAANVWIEALKTDNGKNDSTCWMAVARFRERTSDYSAAKDAIIEALSLITKDEHRLAALKTLDRILEKLEENDKRLELLTTQIIPISEELDDRETLINSLLISAELYQQIGEIESSLSSLTKASSLNPNNLLLLEQCADTHELLGDWNAAKHEINKALDQCDTKECRAHLLLRLGQIATHQNKDGDAINLFTQALDCGLSEEQEELTWRRIISLHLRRGDPLSAAKISEKIAEQSKEPTLKAEQLFSTADIWLKKANRQEDALRCLRQAINVDPRHAQSLDLLESLATTRNDEQELAFILRLKVELASGKPNTQKALLSRLAHIQINQDKISEAKTTCTTALAIDQKYIPALCCAARVALAEGVPEVAFSYDQNALKQFENTTHNPEYAHLEHEILLRLGGFAESSGDLEKAEEFYNRALAVDESQPGALNALIGILKRAGRYEEVLVFQEQLFSISPPHILNNLRLDYASTLEHLGAIDKAIEIASAALYHDPFSQDALDTTRDLLRRSGRLIELLEILESRAEKLEKEKADSITLTQSWLDAAELADQLNLVSNRITSLRRANSISPGNFNILNHLINALKELGPASSDELIDLLELRLNLETDPERSRGLLDEIVEQCIEDNKKQHAINTLKNARNQDWIRLSDLDRCGQLLVEEDLFDEAIKAYKFILNRKSEFGVEGEILTLRRLLSLSQSEKAVGYAWRLLELERIEQQALSIIYNANPNRADFEKLDRLLENADKSSAASIDSITIRLERLRCAIRSDNFTKTETLFNEIIKHKEIRAKHILETIELFKKENIENRPKYQLVALDRLIKLDPSAISYDDRFLYIELLQQANRDADSENELCCLLEEKTEESIRLRAAKRLLARSDHSSTSRILALETLDQLEKLSAKEARDLFFLYAKEKKHAHAAEIARRLIDTYEQRDFVALRREQLAAAGSFFELATELEKEAENALAPQKTSLLLQIAKIWPRIGKHINAQRALIDAALLIDFDSSEEFSQLEETVIAIGGLKKGAHLFVSEANHTDLDKTAQAKLLFYASKFLKLVNGNTSEISNHLFDSLNRGSYNSIIHEYLIEHLASTKNNALLAKAYLLSSNLGNNSERTDTLLKAAHSYALAKDNNQYIEEISSLIQRAQSLDDNLDHINKIADIWLELGEEERAEDHLSSFAKRSTQEDEIEQALQRACAIAHARSDLEKESYYLNLLSQLKPQNSPFKKRLREAYRAAGDLEGLGQSLAEMVDHDDHALFELATLYSGPLQRAENAIELYHCFLERSVSPHPRRKEALEKIIELERHNDRPKDLAHHLGLLFSELPEQANLSRGKIALERARVFIEELNLRDEAMDSLRIAIELLKEGSDWEKAQRLLAALSSDSEEETIALVSLMKSNQATTEELEKLSALAENKTQRFEAIRRLLNREILHKAGDELIAELKVNAPLEAAELLQDRITYAISVEKIDNALVWLEELWKLRFRLNQNKLAHAALKQAIELEPENAVLLTKLTPILEDKNTDESVIPLLEDLLPYFKGTHRLKLLEKLATLHDFHKKEASAHVFREELFRLDPSRKSLILPLLQGAINTRDINKAHQFLTLARDESSINKVAIAHELQRLAIIENENDNDVSAILLLQEASQLAPKVQQSFHQLIQIGIQKSDARLIANSYQALADLDPEKRSQYLFQALTAWRELSDSKQEQETILRDILSIDPNQKEAIRLLESLLRDEKNEGALADFLYQRLEKGKTLSQKKLFELIEIEDRRGNSQRGDNVLRIALRVQKADLHIIEALADRLLRRGTAYDAIEMLERTFIEIKSSGPLPMAKISYKIATICIERLEDHGRAEIWLKKGIQLDPKNEEIRKDYLELLLQQGRHTEAIELLLQEEKVSNTSRKRILNVELFELYRHIEKHDDALDSFEKAYWDDSETSKRLPPNIILSATELYIRRGNEEDKQKAIKLLAHLEKAQLGFNEQHRLAKLYTENKEFDKAISLYTYLLEYAPSPQIRLNLGKLYYEQKNMTEAVSYLGQAADELEQNTLAAEAAYICGRAFEQLDLVDAALIRFEQAIEKSPSHLSAWQAVLLRYKESNDKDGFSRAINALRSLKQNTNDLATHYYTLASMQFKSGEFEQAKKSAHEAITLKHDLFSALIILKDCAFHEQDWNSVSSYYEQIIPNIEDKEERAQIHKEYALFFEAKCSAPDKAIAELKKATSLSEDPYYNDLLLDILERSDRPNDAATHAIDLSSTADSANRRRYLIRGAKSFEQAAEYSAAKTIYQELSHGHDTIAEIAIEKLEFLANNETVIDKGHVTLMGPFYDSVNPDINELRKRAHNESSPKKAAQFYLQLAKILEAEKSTINQAIDAYLEALRLQPHDLNIAAIVADASYRFERWGHARELYDRIWHDIDTSAVDKHAHPSIPKKMNLTVAELSYRRGVIYEALGYEATANHCYAETLEYSPNHRAALEARTRLALYREEPERAIDVLLELTKMVSIEEPNRLCELRTTLGELYIASGDMSKARRKLEGALELDPRSERAMQLLLTTYNQLKEYQLAADIAERLAHQLEDNQSKAGLLFHRSQLLSKHLKDEDEAINCLLKAYDISPLHIPTLWHLVEYYWQEGDLESVSQMGLDLIRSEAPLDTAKDIRLAYIALSLCSSDEERATNYLQQIISDKTIHSLLAEKISYALDKYKLSPSSLTNIIRRADKKNIFRKTIRKDKALAKRLGIN